jgi:hypothetical protein
MLKNRNQVFEQKLQEKLSKKSGPLFVKQMSGSVVSVLRGQNVCGRFGRARPCDICHGVADNTDTSMAVAALP